MSIPKACIENGSERDASATSSNDAPCLVNRLITPLTPAAKATDENLASEDWDTNLQICDKVGDEGQNGCVELQFAPEHS